jgi:hypothetical protein
MNDQEIITKKLSSMIEEERKVEQLINLFIFGLFLVLVMYLYLL